jgi:5-methylcytosine-specific restriction enzyme subunit McrC
VNEKNRNIAHPEMLAFRGTRTRQQKTWDLCDKSGIRHTQVRGQALVERHMSGKVFNLIPDLELRQGVRRVIADTKWKLIDESDRRNRYNISQSDIYQLFAYSRKYLADHDDRRVVLIYPRTDSFRQPLEPFWYKEGEEVLYVLPYDLEHDELDLSVLG